MPSKWAGFTLMTLHSLHEFKHVVVQRYSGNKKSVKLVQCCWDIKPH